MVHRQGSKQPLLSQLTDSDQAKLEAFIEEFFFDESHEEEDLNPPSKIDKNEYINYE